MSAERAVSVHTVFDGISEDEVEVDVSSEGWPPPYEYIRAKPPSYDGSLIARIKAAKHQAKSAKQFVDSLCGILCAAAVTFIGMCIVIALPFVMIVVGSLYIDRCPAEPYIPIYLVAFGSVFLVTVIASVSYSVMAKKERRQAQRDRVGQKPVTESNSVNFLVCLIVLLVAVLIMWQFAAYVWVFRIHEPNFTEPESPEYCFQPLYYLAFWLTIASFVIYATSLCVGCTLCCCVSVSR